MTQSVSSINAVIDADLCAGCGACAFMIPDKLSMNLEDSGYLRPIFKKPLTEDEEKRALSVCPGIAVESINGRLQYNDLWGEVVQSRVGWAVESNLRYFASSGGVLSALAINLLESGQVEAVLHIGVSKEDPLINVASISRNAAEVKDNAGSRYAPSAPIVGLSDAIMDFNSIAFIGKPCDVVAVRKIALHNEEVNKRVKIFLSFMCAGVPSMAGTFSILDKFGIVRNDVVSFRYRGNGWPGRAAAVTTNGAMCSMSYDESWGGILNKYLQFRCKICFDGTGESADVTCADAWYGGDSGYPSFEELEGRSLILTRTSVGEKVVQSAIMSNMIVCENAELDCVLHMQPYQAARKKMIYSRLLAMRLFGRVTPVYSLNILRRLARQAGLKANIVSFVGMCRRLLKQQ